MQKKMTEGIFKRPDSRFYWVCVRGQRFSTKTTDIKTAKEILHQRWNDAHNLPNSTRAVPLEQYTREFKEWYKMKVVPRVYASETGRIDIFLNAARPRSLNDIDFNLVNDFLIKKSRTVSKKTRNLYRQIIKTYIDYAIKKGYLTHNPVTRIEILKLDKTRPYFFSKEQIELLLKASPSHFQIFIILGIYTGMRAGEIMNLKWSDIDFKSNCIYIDKAKSKRFRVIPMHPKLRSFLAKQQDKGFVLRRKDGQPYKYRESAKKAFQLLLERTGIKLPKGVKFHAFRHTCASWLVMSGLDMYAVKEILGHRDFATTQRYAHLNQDYLQAQIRKLNLKNVNET